MRSFEQKESADAARLHCSDAVRIFIWLEAQLSLLATSLWIWLHFFFLQAELLFLKPDFYKSILISQTQ